MIKEIYEIRKLLFLSVIVGVVAGLFTAAFLKSLDFSTQFFLGHIVGYTPPKPAGEGGGEGYVFYIAHKALLPVVTAIGGLIVGFLVYYLAPEAAGIGTDVAIKAFHYGLPIGIKSSILKLITSAITIGSGGSSGREGPMALIGAGIGRGLGDLLKLSSKEKNILLAAGLGAGIGAVFRAPLAGGILSAEVFYKEDFEVEALVPGFLASIIAYLVAGAFVGYKPLFYTHIPFPHFSSEILGGYVVLGIVSAFVAKFLIWTFYKVKEVFDSLKVHPILKPAIGGFLVGLCGLVTPLAIGNSYGWVQMLMKGELLYISFPVLILSVPLVVLALSLTLGSGGSGGVFGPSLVIGGITGAVLSRFFNDLLGAQVFDMGTMTVVGMVSVFTAAASAPLSTIVLVAEMTQGYNVLPYALISMTLAQNLAGNERTIFYYQKRNRLESPVHKDELKAYILKTAKVKDVMTTNVITLTPEDPVIKAKEIMAKRFIAGIPIVIGKKVVGIVTTSDVLKVEPEKMKETKVKEIMTPKPRCVLPDWDLLEVMRIFTSEGYGRAPVVKDFESMELVGIISRSDIARYLVKRGVV
ncbi:chloride channel protein [Thermovibrio ammonificans]|uniref:Cl-channel voltage-gated family protein n=1 Tax=Thermovibrio ammonificans (strain DSM 15698 / JCM 12110 / HB-1) TaxID=648996 RepID=E8T2A2_THEA1|nr:chloride channel protein [Thermovibrio ammonificans]ADU96997.1 Cl- channel voltage-gated family protein [Thermovibrio ammonificans HB-1]